MHFLFLVVVLLLNEANMRQQRRKSKEKREEKVVSGKVFFFRFCLQACFPFSAFFRTRPLFNNNKMGNKDKSLVKLERELKKALTL